MVERRNTYFSSTWGKACLILIICTFGMKLQAYSQDEMEVLPKNGRFEKYIQFCQNNINTIQALPYADKLYQEAERINNQQIQATSLYYKTISYVYQSSTEQIIQATENIKKYAKKTKQPYYYYLGWSNGIIRHYITTGRLNLALEEIKKMQKDAGKDKSDIGIATCYHCFSAYYEAQGIDQLAFESKQKEIKILEKNRDYQYNISYNYIDICNYYIHTKQYGNAGSALIKAEKDAHTISQQFIVAATYLRFYTNMKNWKNASMYMEKAEKMLTQYPILNLRSERLYENKFLYYQAIKQYDKALDMLQLWCSANNQLHYYDKQYKLSLYKAQIYEEQGNMTQALAYYKKYATDIDSLKLNRANLSIGEYVTILNMDQLSSDNDKLNVDYQKNQLKYRRNIIFFMSVFLCLFFVLLLREKKLNNRLKISEFEALEHNLQLTKSQKELKLAKIKVEQASQMKTEFIQNMTHQIRTPLNQIVGFSQVLTSYFNDNNEHVEYANIIESSSNELLSLINDVLNISELDQMETIPCDFPCEINGILQSCIDLTKRNNKKDIEFVFNPTSQMLMIMNDANRLMQIIGQLLRNAIRFTNQGNIIVDYQINEIKQTLQISVSDTGPGIPIEKQEEVFERFYKLNEFTQGTGLGLSIARTISEKMGGTLNIDKYYTSGSRFILTLPLIYPKPERNI